MTARRCNVLKLLSTRALLVFCVGLSGCHYFSTESQINYGLNHYEMGLYGHAIPALVSAADSLEGKKPLDPRLVEVLVALGTMAASEKRNDLARDFYLRGLKAAEALQPIDNTRLRNSLVNLGMFYSYNDRAKDSLPILQRATSISKTFNDQTFYAIDLDNLASAYQNLKQYVEASELQLKALGVVNEMAAGKFLLRTKGTILHNLGRSFVEIGRHSEAETRFKESIAVLTMDQREAEPWRIRTAKKSYVDLLMRMGREKEAKDLKSQIEAPVLPQSTPTGVPRPTVSGRG